MAYVELALRLSLAGVFLVSGLSKARVIEDSVEMWAALRKRFRPQGKNLDRGLAWVLVCVETVTGGVLLVPGPLATLGKVLAATLMSAFTVVAAISALSLLDVKCACFGSAKSQLGWRHVWRNLVLLAIAVGALVSEGVDTHGDLAVDGMVIAVVTAVTVTALAAFFDQIAHILRDNW
ncbi:MauE/DoxX family redox-associated membrane protein [Streptomyces goshikiensis]|uniref:MauE/DoxX family redox-associated membrane protein n=1 Tax=Streptomyces goshikiensis TaxID=1942 RepID=UPI0036A7DC6F